MGLKLDPKKLERLIVKADNLWYKGHVGQYRYQEHVKYTAEYIVRHYNDKVPERKEHAVTHNKHRGGEKVSQPKMRLGEKGHRGVHRKAKKGIVSPKKL